jgi:hypothetical protein
MAARKHRDGRVMSSNVATGWLVVAWLFLDRLCEIQLIGMGTLAWTHTWLVASTLEPSP